MHELLFWLGWGARARPERRLLRGVRSRSRAMSGRKTHGCLRVLAWTRQESVSGTRLERIVHGFRLATVGGPLTPPELFAQLKRAEQWALAIAVLSDSEMSNWAFQAGTALATLLRLARDPVKLIEGLSADGELIARRMCAAATLQLEKDLTDGELIELLRTQVPLLDRELATVWLTTGTPRWYRLLRVVGAEPLLSIVPPWIRELGLANLEDRLPDPSRLSHAGESEV